MHAITIPEPGGPDALVWAEVPDPVPGEGEVLVEVVAAGVNRADMLQRQGFYHAAARRLALPRPGVLGPDRGARPRRRPAGPSATRCARCSRAADTPRRSPCPVGQLLPVPEGVDLVTAAALPEVTCTVWSNVFMIAHLRPGETLLVHGGSSGIGTMAIQLAKAVGARVAVTAGGAGEAGALPRAGRRHPDQLPRAGLRRGGPRGPPTAPGADVILDNIGREVPGPQRARRSPSTAGSRSSGCRAAQGRAEPRRAARASAPPCTRHLAAGPPARREGGDRRGRARARLAAGRRPAGSARSSTARSRCARPRTAHRLLESSEHVGKVLLTT